MDADYDVAVIGAYVRHAREIAEARDAFLDAGLTVVFPEDMDAFELEEYGGEESDYVVVTPDAYGTRDRFEQEVFDAIARSDVVYCCNPHGSLDRLSAAAAGYGAALGRRLYAQEPIEDGHLHQFLRATGSPDQVVEDLRSGKEYPLDTLHEHSSLSDLQRYMAAAAAHRDVDGPRTILRRMANDAAVLVDHLEEGEEDAVRHEMDDRLGSFLAGILAIANAYDVDLSRAFREHEAELF